ncbi:MAG: ABC transporter substrate-binding protein [Alphaproteobacteria bacterium]|nr:ABC transporter substrate-binding protein [Alphaproteobacteria bacterium]
MIMTSPQKKTYTFVFVLIVGILIFLGYRFVQNQEPTKNSLLSPQKTLVAITQIAPHPSLDSIRKGILDVLKENNIPESGILFQNAQGNVSTAAQISQKFASLSPQVIVPITTPSSQSAYAAAKARNIPVVFVAVSDPVAAKLSANLEKGSEGITGVYDQAPVEEQANLIKEILNLKDRPITIGILYNPGEANSVSMVERMSEALKRLNILVLKVAASATTEVSTATKSLIDKVDAIYIPNDNTLISALDAVLKVSQEHKIPVFSSDPESVERGCIATLAPNQYEIGRQAGKMIVSVLKGTSVGKIPLEKASALTLILNQEAARHLGITFPQTILTKANKIINASIEIQTTSLKSGAKNE